MCGVDLSQKCLVCAARRGVNSRMSHTAWVIVSSSTWSVATLIGVCVYVCVCMCVCVKTVYTYSFLNTHTSIIQSNYDLAFSW